jgi:hypothetical protein
MQRRSQVTNWRIKGVTDALDSSMTFRGSMQALSNLIPDQSSMNIWECRPASGQLINFGGTTGTISVAKISGDVVYGMIGQTAGGNSGFDIPFAYNLLTNLQITVTGTQTPTTLPTSPALTGPIQPPQMDLIGVKMMVASAGFSGAGGNFVGWFDLTNPFAPVWNAGNLTGGFVSFTVAPIAVKQFFNRAYYIHNAPGAPAVIFSDALNATNCTFATQVITFGDNTALTALGALPLQNVLGGIVQAIMVFKRTNNIYQITGDAGLNNLYVNSLNVATGTQAPNSIVPTPKGLAFLAPDGFRLIDQQSNISDPIGAQGSGVIHPFLFASQPSRVFASCNGTLMRVSTQNASVFGAPQQDWWFDFVVGCWTGPHTFPGSISLPYSQTFIIAPVGVLNSLWQSDFLQSLNSTFVENGVPMTFLAQTSLLPDMEQLTNNAMTESSIDLAIPPNTGDISVAFVDQMGSPIAQVALPAPVGTAAIWGPAVWGSFTWGGGPPGVITPYQLQWPVPIVFARGSMAVNGPSSIGFKLSTIHMRIQSLKTYVDPSLAA